MRLRTIYWVEKFGGHSVDRGHTLQVHEGQFRGQEQWSNVPLVELSEDEVKRFSDRDQEVPA